MSNRSETGRKIVYRYTLREPLVEDGLTEIVWRKPTMRTMRRLGATEIPGDQAALVANEMTGIPIEVLDRLDFVDAVLISNVTMDIVQKKSREAKAAGEPLGIEVEVPETQAPKPRSPIEIEDATPDDVENLATESDDLEESVRAPGELGDTV